MNISNIIYYTRKEGDVTSTTLSLRNLCLREDVELEHIFYAVRDAVDTDDLWARLTRLVYDHIVLEDETPSTIMFTVYDINGNTNYLNFKKKKENNYGT